MPATQTIPENWPVVPVIAINRHPVFPKFIKIVEVTDERLVTLLRRKVKLNQPYAGVFVKLDDDNTTDVVDDVSQVHNVGTFVQIMEMHDLGSRQDNKVDLGSRMQIANVSCQVAHGSHGPQAHHVAKGPRRRGSR